MPRKYSKEQMVVLVDSIKQNLALFDAGVQGRIGDNVVLVIGNTGAGKTTVMNILAGKNIVIQKVGGSVSIDVEGKDYAGEMTATGFRKMEIGHGGQSGTRFPNYITAEGRQFWDCPGFGDNRGPEVEISNMYYVNYIIKHATATGKSGVKLVVVQDSAGTTVDRGKSFKESVRTICKIFEPNTDTDLIRLINATVFVFTKVAADEEEGAEYLKDVLARVGASKEVSETAVAAAPAASTTEELKYDSREEAIICEGFLKMLNVMHSADPTNIKHVEMPKATRKIRADTLLQSILDHHNGIFVKIDVSIALQNITPKLSVSTDSLLEIYGVMTEFGEIILSRVQEVITKLKDERIKSLHGSHAYVKKIADEVFKPIAYEILAVIHDSDTLPITLHRLSDILLRFTLIDLDNIPSAKIAADARFVSVAMEEAEQFSEVLEFLSMIMPDTVSHSTTIASMCLSLIGEVETFSQLADASVVSSHLEQQYEQHEKGGCWIL
jgi:energy-coupling factor transporter ATP-binding protein EcfA2